MQYVEIDKLQVFIIPDDQWRLVCICADGTVFDRPGTGNYEIYNEESHAVKHFFKLMIVLVFTC